MLTDLKAFLLRVHTKELVKQIGLNSAIDFYGAADKGKRMWGQFINCGHTKGEIKSALKIGSAVWQSLRALEEALGSGLG